MVVVVVVPVVLHVVIGLWALEVSHSEPVPTTRTVCGGEEDGELTEELVVADIECGGGDEVILDAIDWAAEDGEEVDDELVTKLILWATNRVAILDGK